jgi:hypothetical protein
MAALPAVVIESPDLIQARLKAAVSGAFEFAS